MRTDRGGVAELLIVAACGAATAQCASAEQTLYRNSERATELVLNLDAIGAWYRSDDAWFGESESFLGAPVDRWAEFGVEPTEWAATELVSVTGVLGVLRSGDAAEQIVGGSRDWTHAMLLVSYSW